MTLDAEAEAPARVPRAMRLLFAGLMAAGGAYDLLRPAPLRAAMDSLDLPHYMLLIVGTGKLAGALALAAPVPTWVREWALGGFLIWFLGGVSCHVLAGHGVGQTAPIFLPGGLLLIVVAQHRRASR